MPAFSNFSPAFLRSGLVIGTIHSAASLKEAQGLAPEAVDLLELRVDAFAAQGDGGLKRVKRAALRLAQPLVITVRDAREGGAAAEIPGVERQRLHREFLEVATFLDIELRNAHRSRRLIEETKEAGRGVILSCHDFKRTPSLPVLHQMAEKAAAAGATVLKLATTTNTPADLATLLQFLVEADANRPGGMRFSVMGMGSYGKLSRLTLGRAGSVLNYGFLHRAQVPGQWPAVELKQRLAEL